jgi:hypothetical protein
MNNSDNKDFDSWQNGDEFEGNNPNNWIPKNGFFYYGPPSEAFKKMWGNLNNGPDFIENMKEYLNSNDIFKDLEKSHQNKFKRTPKNKQKTTMFSQEDYFKLIEIRGYLAITEQHAHVKALDKLLNQIQIIPKDSK